MTKVFTMVSHVSQNGPVSPDGERPVTEYHIYGNVSLVEAQQMLTELIVESARAEGKEAARKEKTNAPAD